MDNINIDLVPTTSLKYRGVERLLTTNEIIGDISIFNAFKKDKDIDNLLDYYFEYIDITHNQILSPDELYNKLFSIFAVFKEKKHSL